MIGPGAEARAERPEVAELRASLSQSPPSIPPKFLYDAVGSALFERITELVAYYPTRTERRLLAERAGEVLGAAGRVDDVIELGSGAALKALPLLTRIAAVNPAARYVALDISPSALERTREQLAGRLDLEVRGLVADYSRALPLPPRRGRGARLVLFLGGTLGNESNASAVALLGRVRAQLDAGDLLLLGLNTVAEPAVIEAAYNDSAGVTAAFNRNVLTAVNRIAGSRFELDDFEHQAPYVEARRRIEMWLRARRDVAVDLGRLGGVLRLRQGQGILTEISRRFTELDLSLLLGWSGFAFEAWLPSPCGRFALALGRARPTLH